MHEPEDRLDSWKEIANYLNREIRTAQRWEKTEGLPVHRLQHAKRGSVYAYRHELDAWWESRKASLLDPAIRDPTIRDPAIRDPTILDPAIVDATTKSASPAPGGAATKSSRRRITIAIGIIVLSAALVFSFWASRSTIRVVPIVDLPGDLDMPTLSPDGREVAFRWDAARNQNGDIYAIRIGAPQSLRRLTFSSDEDYSPAWSPDGRTIAFLRLSGGDTLLMLVPAEGGHERVLRRLEGLPALFSATLDWTGDSKYIASPERAGDSISLRLISVETGQARQLTATPAGQTDMQPSFAPDGLGILYTRAVSASVRSLYFQPLTADLLPFGDSKAIPTFDSIRVESPVWIGTREILFTANPKAGHGIWRVRIGPDGQPIEKPRRESYAAPDQIPVRPSRDMRRLVFSQGREISNIWRVDLRIRPPRLQKLISGGSNNSSAQVSPDGKHIVFESNRSGWSEIWMANADGTALHQLTSNNGPVTGSPVWSPDGRSIAFDSRKEGYPYIYIMPAAAGPVRRLTSTPADNVLPSWSADGSAIYYCSRTTGRFEIWRIPVEGGNAVQITNQGGWAPAESPDGKFLYYQKLENDSYNLHRLRWSDYEDREIARRVEERAFAPAKDGVYFIPEPSPDVADSIQFLGLDGRLANVANIGHPYNRALGLAPDGDYLLFAQLDEWGHRLMLVDGLK